MDLLYLPLWVFRAALRELLRYEINRSLLLWLVHKVTIFLEGMTQDMVFTLQNMFELMVLYSHRLIDNLLGCIAFQLTF